MTNIDRIKRTKPEELAKFFVQIGNHIPYYCKDIHCSFWVGNDKKCEDCAIEWLSEEAKE